MISFIRGLLYSADEASVTIDVAGVGYQIFTPLPDIVKVSGEKGKEVLFHTYLSHKEDSMTLYGFLSEKSRTGFRELIKVSGIGAKVALVMLSHYDVDQLFATIQSEDVSKLTKIPGIGPKTAKKIIFDLKGVIISGEGEEGDTYKDDLISSLTNLGYKEGFVRDRVKKLDDLSGDFEQDFKRLLKELAGK